ncbi:hypothetical protein GCM10027027_09090 [Neomicrococcus lactis]
MAIVLGAFDVSGHEVNAHEPSEDAAAEQIDGLATGQARPQVHIAWHVSKASIKPGGVRPRITIKEANGAGVRCDEFPDHANRGGFSGAVRPQNAVHLARKNVQVKPV